MPKNFGLTNAGRREAALLEVIENLPANLLRAYVHEYLEGQSPDEIDKWVVALRAQDKVPAKEITHG